MQVRRITGSPDLYSPEKSVLFIKRTKGEEGSQPASVARPGGGGQAGAPSELIGISIPTEG